MSEEKLKNRETERLLDFEIEISTRSRIVGSLILCFSGILLYADKVARFIPPLENLIFEDYTLEDYVWVLMQSIAPLFIIIGAQLKPYRVAYLVPVYVYCLQLSWSLTDNRNDHYLANAYAIGICILVLIVFYILITVNNKYARIRSEEMEFIEESKQVLEILKAKVLEDRK